MDLIIIRHAIAGDRAAYAKSGRADSERPVTPRGRAKMRSNAAGLRVAVPALEVIATSPLRRARDTAAIVAPAFGGPKIVVVDALAPGGRRAEVLAWLQAGTAAQVAVVGHEPDLSRLIGWLVTGNPRSLVTLKKGGAALLRFASAPQAGNAEFCGLLTPRILRRLGR